jgi:hypothetical protein
MQRIPRAARPSTRRACFYIAAALLGFLFTATVAHASSVKWIDPTAAELQMTAEPKAPGAPAIILSYEEFEDADSAETTVHVRVKVLSVGGLSAGTLDLPSGVVSNDRFDQLFFARTIHPDGGIVVFSGTPQNSTKFDTLGGTRKVIAMPAVTVGSILEYGYHFAGQNTLFTSLGGWLAPTWRVQQIYFIRSAHFSLKVPGILSDSVHWVANLPSGAAPYRSKHLVELSLQNIPARADEEYMPPPTSAFYNVRFFYHAGKLDDYWGLTAYSVDAAWSDFDRPTRLLRDAVNTLIQPGDTDEAKLRKVYLAVEALDNTDLTRKHSEREDKQRGLKTDPTSAETIWINKRGNSVQLTLLFIALAHSAGYQAYPMTVTSRDHAAFDENVLTWDQMDSMVAIVNVKGRELFFDPGTRLCPFGHMAPWHTNVRGISTEGKVLKIRSTPVENYQSIGNDRLADLTLSPDGSVTGTIKIVWVGTAGLSLRLVGLHEDAHEVETLVEKQLQEQVPNRIEVKLLSLTGLADGEAPLVARFNVLGPLGVSTGKRIILPAHLFAVTPKQLLVAETREQALLFPQAYLRRDQVLLHLAPGLTAEALPESHSLDLNADSAYTSVVQAGAPGQHVIVAQRVFLLKRIDYKPEEYPALHKYFGQISSFDVEQISLKPTTPAEVNSTNPSAR